MKSVFIFFKIFIYYILGNFIFRALLPFGFALAFKIFPSLWGLYISRTLRLSRTLVRFEKERLFLYRTKVSYSTTLKCIFMHILHIHNLPYFTCKNMANYFIAGWVFATISSNNLPFHTPYITPIVITWNI